MYKTKLRYKITSFIPHIKMFGENDINMGSPQRKIASHPASAPGATPLRGVGPAPGGHRADLQQIGRDAKIFASASGWYRAPYGIQRPMERRRSAVSDPRRTDTALIYSELVGTQKFLRPRPDGTTRRTATPRDNPSGSATTPQSAVPPGTVTPPVRLNFVNIFKIVLVRLK